MAFSEEVFACLFDEVEALFEAVEDLFDVFEDLFEVTELLLFSEVEDFLLEEAEALFEEVDAFLNGAAGVPVPPQVHTCCYALSAHTLLSVFSVVKAQTDYLAHIFCAVGL